MLFIISSTVLMHFAAFFLQVFLPLLLIIMVLAKVAAEPTARPMPIPFMMSAVLFDANIFFPPIKKDSLLF